MTAIQHDNLPAEETNIEKPIKRFNKWQRLEHIILLVTFFGLCLTGLPQRYAETTWAVSLINLMGGIESVRIMHRIYAVGMTAGAIFHGGVLTYKVFVLRIRWSMIPTWRDARDVWHWITHNLGFRREAPKMPYYNFAEKAEYLAVVWGTLIMILTGFILWNPIAAANLFPGSVIPASLRAHSAEALLAFVSIITWHFYHVLIKHRNTSMFTGEMSREMMEEEHGAELEAMEQGRVMPMPSQDVINKRRRIFIPYATVMTIILVGLLIYFVTFEDTALDTVPRVAPQVDTTTLVVSASDGNADNGAVLWQSLPCGSCHGSDAQGAPGALNIGLVGTSLEFETFVQKVRSGPADMPAYPTTEISNQQIADLYAWLTSAATNE